MNDVVIIFFANAYDKAAQGLSGEGRLLADVVAAIGSIDIVLGEIDR